MPGNKLTKHVGLHPIALALVQRARRTLPPVQVAGGSLGTVTEAMALQAKLPLPFIGHPVVSVVHWVLEEATLVRLRQVRALYVCACVLLQPLMCVCTGWWAGGGVDVWCHEGA